MTGEPARGTLGGRLRTAKEAAFVGRAAEQALFLAAMKGSEPAILWFHAPGGTGKSALLRRFGEAARAHGVVCVELDLAALDATPAAILAEVERPLARAEHAVVLFDSYERAAAIDGWVRETLLPALPERVIVVLASRGGPSMEWRADPAVAALVQVRELGALDVEASRTLLARRGLADERAAEVIELGRGHPLTLVLLAEVLRSTGALAPSSLSDVPQVLGTLVAQLVREIESPAHRRALEVCAHVRRTTEDLLRTVSDEASTHELMRWLGALPYVSAHRDGVALHPVVRDAIDEDFRWRDPSGYRALHLELARRLLASVGDPSGSEAERERHFLDLLYLRRVSASARQVYDFDTLGSGWAEVPHASERERVAALVEAHEGPTGGRIARFWFDQQRDAFTVLRAPLGEPVVASLHLVLRAIPPEARRLDPAFEQIQRYLEARELRDGDRIVVSRFLTGVPGEPGGRLRHHRPLFLWLTTPQLAFAFTALSDGARWAPPLLQAGHRAEAEFSVDGHTAPILVGDYRARTPADWAIELLARDLDGSPSARSDSPDERRPGLDRQALRAGLRLALESFTRSDQLQHSPLLLSRWARARSGAAAPSASLLRKLILEAVATMKEDPRDAKLARALDAAFLHPAPSRELAAERIDVPFSTFRRHVSRGLERLEEIVWAAERDSA